MKKLIRKLTGIAIAAAAVIFAGTAADTGLIPSLVTPASAEPEPTVVTTWEGLQTALTVSGSIELGRDLIFTDSPLIVPTGVTVNLDLSTYNLRRMLSSPTANGYVIEVQGALNISNGIIKGGNNTGNGGGIYVNGGSITLGDSVFIYDNRAANGGGIYVNGGTVTAGDVAIFGCSATKGGGVYIDNGGTFTMNSSEISGNNATTAGAGVYNGGTFKVFGNAKVTGNGIDATFNDQTGYYSGGTASNVVLGSNKFITVTSSLGSSADIGVTSTGVFAQAGTGYTLTESDIARFSSDSDSYTPALNDGKGKMAPASPWAALQLEINSAANGSTITLDKNYTALSTDSALLIPTGKTVTIDLKGFTLDRNTFTVEGAADVHVIEVVGNLTITDSGTGGTITGGYNNGEGDGGGVYVNGGTFTMSGGKIEHNRAGSGGGVYVSNGGTFNMSGGTISNNTSAFGGVYVADGGTFTMSGGTISENSTSNAPNSIMGEGVYVRNGGTFNVSGGAKITGNENDNITDNVYLEANAFITVTASLTSDADIGISGGGEFVAKPGTGYTISESDLAHFKSNDPDLTPVLNASGNIELVNNWAALQAKINSAANGSTITLDKNTTAGSTDYALVIPSGKKITLDLKGYTIDRGLKDQTAKANGCVIKVQGELTIKDGSTAKTGTITGGNNVDFGGGIYVEGTLNMSGGTISDNSANGSNNGDGVYVENGGIFNMSGGAIIGSTTGDYAGCGVYVADGGTFTMSGSASISKCDLGVWTNGTFTMSGNAVISLNTKGVSYNNGTFNVSGGVRITAYAIISSFITVTDTLTSDATIVIGTSPDIVAKPGSGYTIKESDLTHFKRAALDYAPALNSDGNIVWADSWRKLNERFAEASTDKANPTTIKLTHNYFAESGNSCLLVKSGTYVILDLNGYTLDRKLTEGKDTGCVIKVLGSLTVKDSRTGGKITGGFINKGSKENSLEVGYTIGCGGGIYVEEGSLTLESGEISGNKATDFGGGVYIYNGEFTMSDGKISENTANGGGGVYADGGTFTMTGGTISGNTASSDCGGVCAHGAKFTMKGGKISGNTASDNSGGVGVDELKNLKGGARLETPIPGVFTMEGGEIIGNDSKHGGGVDNGGTFTMTGGTISGNTARVGGGVDTGGTFTMTGGTISGNTVSMCGGGVFNEDTFELSGGTISGNTADEDGGGVYNSGTFKLSGSPTITENVMGGTAENVLNDSEKEITVIGKLTSTALIGVRVKNGDGEGVTGVFASGVSGNGTVKNFRSDDGFMVAINAEGKGELVEVSTPTCEHNYENGVCTFCGGRDPDYKGPYNGGNNNHVFYPNYTPSTPSSGDNNSNTDLTKPVTPDKAAEAVKQATEGSTIKINMGDTTKLTQDVISAVKGKDVNVELDMGNGVKWTINGKDVDSVIGDINMGVTVGKADIPVEVINSVTDERYNMMLSLDHEGPFGFTATLTVQMRTEDEGMIANLFWFDPDANDVKFISSGKIRKNGTVDLEFGHASAYIIIIDDHVLDGENIDADVDAEEDDADDVDDDALDDDDSDVDADVDADVDGNPGTGVPTCFAVMMIAAAVVAASRKKK